MMLMSPGGLWDFLKMLESHEIAVFDLTAPLVAHLMILMTFVFSWQYHTVSVEVLQFKKDAIESWEQRRHEPGMRLDIPPDQIARINSYQMSAQVASPGNQKGHGGRWVEEAAELYVMDLLDILYTLPGWGSWEDFDEELTGEQGGFRPELNSLKEQAESNGVWPIDVYTMCDKQKEERQISCLQLLGPNVQEWWKRIVVSIRKLGQLPCMTILTVLLLAVTLVLIPRLWLRFYLGGVILPSSLIALVFVMFSSLIIFCCFGIWTATFISTMNEYESNSHQVTLLSALISITSRQKYADDVLVSSAAVSEPEGLQYLSILPLLDLRKSDNARGFWRLREFTVLDRTNERIGMEVNVAMLLLCLLFLIAMPLMDLYFRHEFSALAPVLIFYLMVFGTLVFQSLRISLRVNEEMATHWQVVVSALHDVTLSATLEDAKEDLADLALSARLLKTIGRMIQECDVREKFLFGFDVTPLSIISFMLATIGTVCLVLFEIFAEVHLMKGMRVKA